MRAGLHVETKGGATFSEEIAVPIRGATPPWHPLHPDPKKGKEDKHDIDVIPGIIARVG